MELSEQVNMIDHKVTEILYLLTGTELDKKQGLTHRFNAEIVKNELLHKRVVTLEKWRDRVLYILIGMAIPAGYGISTLIHTLIIH